MKRTFSLSSLMTLALSTFLFVSCKKNIDTEVPTNPVPGNVMPIPAATPVMGSLSGLVVNENNAPVNGAQVNLGSTSVLTDANGTFNFNNVILDKYISTVTVTMNGYFKAYRSFSATAGRNAVSIKLIPKVLSGTVNSASTGVVALTNGTQLLFQANSVKIKSTGAVYTGTVNVYAEYIDPTATDISSRVPGSFIGKDATNLYTLQSTGMIAVELESTSGQPLQLVTDKSATILMPIPATLLSKAPATIDTWSLDEQGVWKKEGTATKSGNVYEMQVTHFSFWNCDVPANAIYLTLHVQDQNSNPLANTVVQLTIPNNTTWWATTYGVTNGIGIVSGIVPAGIALQMNILSNPYSCSTPINTQTIGPFTANTTLTVTATITASQVTTVMGNATDCNNAPLQNGTAIINAGPYNIIYATVTNGSYTATITHCSPITSLNVTILDSTSSSINSSGNITVSGNAVTVPNIIVCGSAQNAVFTFGGQQGNCQSTTSGIYTVGIPITGNNAIFMTVNVTSLGNYQVNTTNVNGISFSASGFFTAFGNQTITLIGTGTPTNSGVFSYQAQAAGVTGCNFIISVGAGQPGQAVFNFGSQGTCQPTIVGNYTVGVPLDSNVNQIIMVVNVTTAGTYYINTGTQINGISFYAYGTFTQTGTQTVTLWGTGTPQTPGTFTYLAQSAGAPQSSCPIIMTVGTSANFTFLMNGSNCSGALINGTYLAGTSLNTQNTVTLSINVTTPGNFNIITNGTNGMSFVANGTFTSIGQQLVTLIGQGTPTATGMFTFIPSMSGINGCIFLVQVN